MRISTVTMFQASLASMNRQQSEFLHISQQIASGKRVVNPSDDPQAASRAVGVSQSLAVNQQYADARISARNALSQEDSVLGSIGDAIASAKTLIVQAGNGTLSDADRASLASDLNGIYESLIGQANTTNGNGAYLFGGFEDDAPPFVRSAGGIEYFGSDNVRAQQVGPSRQMTVGDSGSEIFSGVHSGSGYVAEADSGNTGSVTFTGPARVDASHANYGDGFTITFGDDGAGNPTYSIVNDSTGAAVQTDVAYDPEEGATLTFGGLSLTLEGEPAAGDEISMAKAQDQSLFTTLENVIAALNTPTDTDAAKAALHNTLSTTSRELDNSLNNVLTVRASVGARINELDVLDSVGGNRELNYKSTLSELVDLDLAKATSDYLLQQAALQASQKAFVGIQNLSLFEQL
ncbi:flagellar hook-associated protein 3 FlgL [Modicisalibacter muralis]|uniref:Flagellar hook-associated protein 3 FlgL n=1 Tax=Modicisalibacter muralis TaxID=119000 RepID=A0A1G9FTT5_9GAMM|nr:flagellar hook-associated protein FlgL [Halomonas muralis]SDK91808.1 flagellar hook-associated protein 3 FlgL [Halomonas muralis]